MLDVAQLAARLAFAVDLAQRAGQVALEYFQQPHTLKVSSKGPQDFVSQADYDTELVIRQALADRFPGDAFVGEETGGQEVDSHTGVWVVDPIDGTQPFLMGMATWCVSIAFALGDQMLIGVVYAPVTNELFAARLGHGATCNGRRIAVRAATSLTEGVVSVGYSRNTTIEQLVHVMGEMARQGGMYHRNGSGALSLCYVACGQLIGYIEPYINSWDCLAALVIIREAGGITNDFLAEHGLVTGGAVFAASPAIYPTIRDLLP